MKKVLLSLLAFVSIVGLLSLTSCKKEEAGNGQFTATMESCTSQDGKTVLNGTNLNWEPNDLVTIYGVGGIGYYFANPQTPATVAAFVYSGFEHEISAPCRAYYPYNLTYDGVHIQLPATQTYVEGSMIGFPMYAESNTNMLAFRNLCGALKLHLTKANTSITAIGVTANSQINGTFTLNYNNGDPVLIGSSAATSAPSPSTTLRCVTAQSIDNGADFFIYLPAGNYTGLEIDVLSDDGRYCIKTANVTIPVARSRYTTITLGENDLNFITPPSHENQSGFFSVSETQQVRFSQGNLQYQVSTNTWRFALHQYDFIGYSNSNISSTHYDGWIDLFGWGTGNNPMLSSTDLADYSTFVDWGVNAISNGGNIANMWRTLTSDELLYLLNYRTNSTNLGTANARYAQGTVNNIHGVILFPDGYVHPACVAAPVGINQQNSGGWDGNVYTLNQWSLMEAAGAVFLPAAGYRTPPSVVGNFGGVGSYWTSSTFEAGGRTIVSYLRFSNSYLFIGGSYTDFSMGFSVRLVQDNE